jgi:hypothetical protein
VLFNKNHLDPYPGRRQIRTDQHLLGIEPTELSKLGNLGNPGKLGTSGTLNN